MRTTRLEMVRASVSVATTRYHTQGVPHMNKFEQVSSDHHQMSLPGGPNMNKFEQVSSDHHQMSLAGGIPQVWCLIINNVVDPDRINIYSTWTIP